MFSIHSPLIIDSNLETIHNIFNSEKFIKYIFSIDKSSKNSNVTINNDNIHIIKNYIVSEFIDSQLDIDYDYIKHNLINKIKDLEITLEISQSIVKNDDNVLIIKYICFIDKPPYIKTMLADQNTVYYIKIYKKIYDNKSLSVVNYYRRFIPTDDPELNNDEFIINDNIDITTINNKYDTIKFNDTLLLTAKTFLGQETLDNVIIPFIYNIFDDFINKFLIKKIKKYLKKQNIKIYTSKIK
jgi:hypothetical protein